APNTPTLVNTPLITRSPRHVILLCRARDGVSPGCDGTLATHRPSGLGLWLLRALRGGLFRGRVLTLLYRDQTDLAAVVDVGDLHLDLVANVDDVLALADAFAVTELRDVDETVLAGHQRHERTERRGLDHGAEVPFPDLRQLRIGDRVDPVDRRLGRRTVGGTHVNGAVVLDRDVRTGLLGDRVDHLALGADDLTDLVGGNLHAGHPRRVRTHLIRLRNRFRDDPQDGHTSVPGLVQRRGQHLRGIPSSLVSSCSAVIRSRVPATLKS